MKVELITNIFVLDDKVFREIYKLITSDHMSFNSCLRVDDMLIFTLKDPQRLFTVERVEDSFMYLVLFKVATSFISKKFRRMSKR